MEARRTSTRAVGVATQTVIRTLTPLAAVQTIAALWAVLLT